MLQRKINKGFTLIELLVVIAIIGILSAVVLTSLNTARAKAANGAVKANLDGVKSQAQIVYDNNNGDYSTVCADPNVVKATLQAGVAGGGTAGLADCSAAGSNCVCNSEAADWAAEATLKVPEGANNYWCTDSTGVSQAEPNTIGAGYACAP